VRPDSPAEIPAADATWLEAYQQFAASIQGPANKDLPYVGIEVQRLCPDDISQRTESSYKAMVGMLDPPVWAAWSHRSQEMAQSEGLARGRPPQGFQDSDLGNHVDFSQKPLLPAGLWQTLGHERKFIFIKCLDCFIYLYACRLATVAHGPLARFR